MRLVISSQKLIGLSFVEQTSPVKNRFLTLPYRLVKWHAKRSLPVCVFGKCPQNFRTFTGHL